MKVTSILKILLSKPNSISSPKRLLWKLALDHPACAQTPPSRSKPLLLKSKRRNKSNRRMLDVELTRRRRLRKMLMRKMNLKMLRRLWMTFSLDRISDPRVSNLKPKVCSRLPSLPKDSTVWCTLPHYNSLQLGFTSRLGLGLRTGSSTNSLKTNASLNAFNLLDLSPPSFVISAKLSVFN